MLKKLVAMLALASFVLVGGVVTVHAQGTGPGAVTYKKKTVYDFDDDLVEGELQRPDGEFIDTQRRAKQSSLIKIREDFIPEMLKSAEDI